VIDDIGILVHGVTDPDGILNNWNSNHPEAEMRKDDCITEVNGASGNPLQLVSMMQRNSVLGLTIKRAFTFEIIIVQQGEDLVKSLNHVKEHKTLEILNVDSGLFAQWNQENEGMEVMVGDRIIGVNDISHDASRMMELITSARSLNVMIFRLCEP